MNVPNHSQADRITSDIRKLLDGKGDTLQYWQGNSYRGIPVTVSLANETVLHGIKLKHWDTTIAVVTMAGPIYFDARYISSTTRSFQGRILNAMRTAYGENYAAVVRIAEELALPTGERDVLDWIDDGTIIR